MGAPTEEKPTTTEDRIRAAFPEAPEAMVEIARCESRLRQFKEDGTPLVSETSDVGLFQINQVHWEDARKLGIDIYSEEGNIAFARLLFDANGFGDWFMSNHCHRLLG